MKLLLVNNANAGLKSVVNITAHKVINPVSYNFDLNKLTHGHFRAKEEWAKFLKETKLSIELQHGDEYEFKYSGSYEYPTIITIDNGLHKEILNSV